MGPSTNYAPSQAQKPLTPNRCGAAKPIRAGNANRFPVQMPAARPKKCVMCPAHNGLHLKTNTHPPGGRGDAGEKSRRNRSTSASNRSPIQRRFETYPGHAHPKPQGDLIPKGKPENRAVACSRNPVEELKNAMHSFRPFALFLALSLPVLPALAQSSSTNPQDSPSSSSSIQGQAQQSNGETQGQLTVAARIRLRRQQRRAAAIHDAYDHLFETYANLGYLRFTPGSNQQRTTFYAWDAGLTRYYTERLGVNLEGRGYFGEAYVGVHEETQGGATRPRISQYDVMLGPTYRFYEQPKYSISGRAQAGWALGSFTGDTNGEGSLCNNGPNGSPSPCLLWPDGSSFAANVAVVGDYNIAPSLALRLAPEYMFNGFGSTIQASRGFTIGFVYRFGKQ